MIKEKIFVLAGGTLGHINPALVISKKLSEEGFSIIFITTNNHVIREEYIDEVVYYNSQGLSRKNIFKNIKNFFVNINIYRKIRKLMREYKPVFCLGMGGSISTLGILSGINSHIKCAIHEQNAVMGLGNKIVSKRVETVFTSYDMGKYQYVGNPLESKCYNEKIERKKEDVVIFGGSNGSDAINDFFIRNQNLFSWIDGKVYLFTGTKYYERYKAKIIKAQNEKFIIRDKTNDMKSFYEKAYIVICRGGAGSISELLGYGLLGVVIPSPNVTGNHQYYNALYYHKKECLEMICENNLNQESIINAINKLLVNKRKYLNNIENNLHKKSSDSIVRSVIEIINKKGNK